MSDPLRLAFLGCGFITSVHSYHLQRALKQEFACYYASRDGQRAAAFSQKFGGAGSYEGYDAALADPRIDAVVVAIPPRFHLDLACRALAAGKHVLVEKPAFMVTADYTTAIAQRDRFGRVVIIGENDHYKPLAVELRKLLAEDAIGELVFAHFTSIAKRLKKEDDWRNDESIAGGDAFFEEGIHWLHVAGSLGPTITQIRGYRPAASPEAPDRRIKSMMVAFRYDNGAVGSLYYSREIPSLLQGLRMSKLMGRKGIISYESNGLVMLVRGKHGTRLRFPGIWDIRGYRAMYKDFAASIRAGRQPEMSLERALADQVLMDQVYATAG